MAGYIKDVGGKWWIMRPAVASQNGRWGMGSQMGQWESYTLKRATNLALDKEE